MTETAAVSSAAKDLAKQMIVGLEGIKEDLREEVVGEVRGEMEAEYQVRMEESMAQLGVYFRDGEIDGVAAEAGGSFSLHDMTFAKEAQTFLQEAWTPLVVKADSAAGGIREADVKHGLEVFFAGAPFTNSTIAGDSSSELLLRIMEASEQRWKISPTMRSAVRSISNYTLGSGVNFTAANSTINSELSEFWKMNKMDERMMGAVQRRALLSEHFFRYRIAKSGDIFVFDGTKPYDVGKVFVHPDDPLRPLAYGVTNGSATFNDQVDEDRGFDWFPDMNYYNQLESPIGVRITGKGGRLAGKVGDTFNRQNRMQMCRSNAMGSIRGVTDAYTILRWDKIYEDFVMDRAILNHERSKVVWVRMLKGSRNLPQGRAQRSPKGGQVLTETGEVEWKAISANINASDVTEDGRLIRLMIMAGWGGPEHLIFQDASEQVYASIRESDTPFSQMIAWGQAAWVQDIQGMHAFVVREKVRLNRLPKKVPVAIFSESSRARLEAEVKPMILQGATEAQIGGAIVKLYKEATKKTVRVNSEDVRIRVDFPNVIQLDPLKKAQVSEVLKRSMLASGTDLAAEHGRDYMESMNELSSERDNLIDLGLIDDKVVPAEQDKTVTLGKNDTKSPTTRNEPSDSDPPTDRMPDGEPD